MGLTGLKWSSKYFLSAPNSPQAPLLTDGSTRRRAVVAMCRAAGLAARLLVRVNKVRWGGGSGVL